MKKTFLSVLLFFLFSLSTNANEIDKIIKKNGFEMKSTVSIYAKRNNKILYKKYSQKLLNPASILKVLTFGASYIVLGDNYNFETTLYKDNQNNYYVKLGADTLLTTKDLAGLFSKIKNSKINRIYIDDSIIDKSDYPQSWMGEDMYPTERAITPYIVDDNTVEIAIKRSALATNIDIVQNDPYKIPVINQLKLGNKQDYKIEKAQGENSNILVFSGTILNDEIFNLPVLKPEVNFNIKLMRSLDKAGIKYLNTITTKKIPKGALKVGSVSHSISDISKKILLNSDNFSSEVVFKVAAAKYINYSHPATLDDAIVMFNDIYQNEITEGIKISDGSGVSRHNLVNAEFIVNCFEKLFKNKKFENLLATANQGTLSNRVGFLENNLRAKTGTLSDMSSIAGSLMSKKGSDIIFAIIIQNSPKRKAVLKNFENDVITSLYRKY